MCIRDSTDEEAELVTRWVPLSEAVAAVLEGRITNGTTVSALLALQSVRACRDRQGADLLGRLRPAEAPFLTRPGRD